jgi:hypothetical protein
MGACISIVEEDEDDKAMRIKSKRKAKELHEFSQQLRKQKCHSQLDMSGKGVSRVKVKHPSIDHL